LDWRGETVAEAITAAISAAMATSFLLGEEVAKGVLVPGHGYDTGTMQRGTHVAAPGYPWPADNVEASPSSPERGGQRVEPLQRGPQGVLALELGCGQDYAIYYHQEYDDFLARGKRVADNALPAQIHLELAARGYA
jgi:hypothetical protein